MALQPEHRQEEWYQQMINAATGKYLPSITSQDAGKVMTVESDGSWGVENVPTELPSVSGTDEGKVLTVNNSGVWGASGDIVLNVIQDGYQLDVTSDLPSMETVANTFKSGRNVVLAFANGDKCVLKPSKKETSLEFDYYTFNGYGYDREGQKYHAYINLYDDEGITAYHAYYIDADRFIVTLTPTAQDYSGTMDKTVAEIDAAYKAGQEIWFEISDGYTTNSFAMTMIYRDNSAYPSFTGYIIYHDMIIDVATGSTNLGTSNTYNTIVYTLTPAT